MSGTVLEPSPLLHFPSGKGHGRWWKHRAVFATPLIEELTDRHGNNLLLVSGENPKGDEQLAAEQLNDGQRWGIFSND